MVEKIITLTAEHLGISEDGISDASSFKEDTWRGFTGSV